METRTFRSQKISKVIKTSQVMLRFAWKEKEGRIYILLMFIMALVNAAFSIIYAVFPGLIINELIESCNIHRIIMCVAVVTLTPVASHYINKFHQLYSYQLRNDSELRLITNFYDYCMSMDYETLEKPDIQILKRRAFNALDNVFGYIGIITNFFSALIMIFTMSTIVTTLNPIIILLVISVVIINSRLAKDVNDKSYAINKSKDNYENYSDIVRYMMSYLGYAQENRLFGVKKTLLDKFSRNSKLMNNYGYALEKNSYRSISCNTLSNMVQQVVLYAYLIYSVIVNGLGIGNLSIYMSSVSRLSGALNSIFSSYLSLARNSLDIQDYIDFMSIPSLQKNSGNDIPIVTPNSIIEFKNVSFRYPGNNRFVIKDLNLRIKCNEKICIVGANGSGKTTFVKLLTRLYFPTEGEILLDGVNINTFDYDKYQALFAPVFQNYAIYSMTLEENIVLSAEKNLEKLNEVCTSSDLNTFIEKLAQKYDTQIGKEIDSEGIIPSGGEGQKIAIARMLYHDRPLFILDEPTATLDPISENQIYKRIHEVIRGKAAVMITHRLSAVQLADKVAVFADGQVAEYGTHAELYAKGGIYTEMFDKQAQFYRNEAPATENAQEQ